MRKTAFITGLNGQDGSYLSELLLSKGYEVFGLIRNHQSSHTNVYVPKNNIFYGELTDESLLGEILLKIKPDEVYNLAGVSDLKTAFDFPERTMLENYHAVRDLIESALKANSNVRFFQALSSEVFDKYDSPQNEETTFVPLNPYAEAKARAHTELIVRGREKGGAYLCSGFLFNHESPRRDGRFVTRKITQSLAQFTKDASNVCEVGNLEAKRDWGFAGDYVRAMWMMLQQKDPRDYVIATGETHTVREFIEIACSVFGIDIRWKGVDMEEVGVDNNGTIVVKVHEYLYKKEDAVVVGDISKIKKEIGWHPEVSFTQLVTMMSEADLARISNR